MALQVKRRAYLEAHVQEADACGRRQVIANGYARERQTTNRRRVGGGGRAGGGRPPRGQGFTYGHPPPYRRRSRTVTDVLPILYLWGLSTGDFVSALAVSSARWSEPVTLAKNYCAAGAGRLVIAYRVNAGPLSGGQWCDDRRQGGRLIGEICHFVDEPGALIGSPPAQATALPSAAASAPETGDFALTGVFTICRWRPSPTRQPGTTASVRNTTTSSIARGRPQ